MTRKLVSVTYLSRELLADFEFRERFRAGWVRLAQLRDARVARFRHYVEYGDEAAVITDHVKGTRLRVLLRAESVIGPGAALVVFKDSLRGLAAGHAAGLAHGDVKPETVVLTRAGRVRLLDFGLSAFGSRPRCVRSTPFYQAPEQGQRQQATPAGDIYAATVMFFECLVGGPPFHSDDLAVLSVLHEQSAPPLDDVPVPVRELVRSGLAKNSAHRPDVWRLLGHLEEVAIDSLGSGWERRARRELARLLAGSSHPRHGAVPGKPSRFQGADLSPSVRFASLLGGALLAVAVMSSPTVPHVGIPIPGDSELGGLPPVPAPSHRPDGATTMQVQKDDSGADEARHQQSAALVLPTLSDPAEAEPGTAVGSARSAPTTFPEIVFCQQRLCFADSSSAQPNPSTTPKSPTTPVLMSTPPTTPPPSPEPPPASTDPTTEPPAGPSEPPDPEGPSDPESPSDPEDSSDPEGPSDPGSPSDPENSSDPENASDPADSSGQQQRSSLGLSRTSTATSAAEPVADEPVADEPVADEPVADEPVAAEPSDRKLASDQEQAAPSAGQPASKDIKNIKDIKAAQLGAAG